MFFKLKFLFLICFVFLNLYGNEANGTKKSETQKITKEWIKSKPKGHIRDFYLWRYLDHNSSESEVIWALSEASNANHKIFFKYTKKAKDDGTNFALECLNMPTNKLIETDGSCINIGLSILEATDLKGEKLATVIEKIKQDNLKKTEKLQIINSDIPFESLINSSSNEIFFGTFSEVGKNFRVQYFNAELPKELIVKLQNDKVKFKQFLKTTITTPQITTLQQSFFDVNTTKLDFDDVFFLAMNGVKHDRNDVALKYLEVAFKKAYHKFDQDNVLFWQYRLTNDKRFLTSLADSWDINIYSVLAKDELKLEIKNAVYDFNETTGYKFADANNIDVNTTSFDTKDPFAWRAVVTDVKDLNSTKMEKYRSIFNTKETLGHLTVLEEKYNKQKISYFPNPFSEYIKDYSIHRQALINALARQESRFVQASLSSSYAMGVMQIMPFLSEILAKELNEPYDILNQFDAKTNIRYANQHLNYLEQKLPNVLFVSYAYNGGIGFTNRMLQSGLFKKGPHEPFLSMELVNYDESKKYGKKVLLNYLIYFNKLSSEKITLSTLLEKISSPYLD